MTETIHLMPPETGPRANPVLFAVAAALAELCPLVVVAPQPRETARTQPEPQAGTPTETAAKPGA